MSGCICEGNWRAIVRECESLLDRRYVEQGSGREYIFFGVVHASDDYFYGMWSREHGMILLTCCGSLEGQGFILKDETVSQPETDHA